MFYHLGLFRLCFTCIEKNSIFFII